MGILKHQSRMMMKVIRNRIRKGNTLMKKGMRGKLSPIR